MCRTSVEPVDIIKGIGDTPTRVLTWRYYGDCGYKSLKIAVELSAYRFAKEHREKCNGPY